MQWLLKVRNLRGPAWFVRQFKIEVGDPQIMRGIRERDAAYSAGELPEHWAAQRDRRYLLNLIDQLKRGEW